MQSTLLHGMKVLKKNTINGELTAEKVFVYKTLNFTLTLVLVSPHLPSGRSVASTTSGRTSS